MASSLDELFPPGDPRCLISCRLRVQMRGSRIHMKGKVCVGGGSWGKPHYNIGTNIYTSEFKGRMLSPPPLSPPLLPTRSSTSVLKVLPHSVPNSLLICLLCAIIDKHIHFRKLQKWNTDMLFTTMYFMLLCILPTKWFSLYGPRWLLATTN